MRILTFFVLLALAPALAAAGAPGAAVDVGPSAFTDHGTGTPVTLVAPGTTVTWHDVSGTHTVTALDGSFDSGNLAPGESFSRAFDAPGAYAYRCALHLSMVGVVVVA